MVIDGGGGDRVKRLGKRKTPQGFVENAFFRAVKFGYNL